MTTARNSISPSISFLLSLPLSLCLSARDLKTEDRELDQREGKKRGTNLLYIIILLQKLEGRGTFGAILMWAAFSQIFFSRLGLWCSSFF